MTGVPDCLSDFPLVVASDEDPMVTEAAPEWFAAFVTMGAALARGEPRGRSRLVIAVSVPARALCGVAVALGFAIATAPRKRKRMAPEEIREAASGWAPGTLVRLVHERRVQVLRYHGLTGPDEIHLGGSRFRLDRIVLAEKLPESFGWSETRAHGVPDLAPGLAALLPGADTVAFALEAAARTTLVGTRTLLCEDLDTRVGHPSAISTGEDLPRIRDVLRPFGDCAPVGWRSVIATAASADFPPAATRSDLAVLDGAGAISWWLRDAPARVVVTVVDRSSAASESAALALGQQRLTAQPYPIAEIGWQPPAACEVLAFWEEGW